MKKGIIKYNKFRELTPEPSFTKDGVIFYKALNLPQTAAEGMECLFVEGEKKPLNKKDKKGTPIFLQTLTFQEFVITRDTYRINPNDTVSYSEKCGNIRTNRTSKINRKEIRKIYTTSYYGEEFVNGYEVILFSDEIKYQQTRSYYLWEEEARNSGIFSEEEIRIYDFMKREEFMREEIGVYEQGEERYKLDGDKIFSVTPEKRVFLEVQEYRFISGLKTYHYKKVYDGLTYEKVSEIETVKKQLPVKYYWQVVLHHDARYDADGLEYQLQAVVVDEYYHQNKMVYSQEYVIEVLRSLDIEEWATIPDLPPVPTHRKYRNSIYLNNGATLGRREATAEEVAYFHYQREIVEYNNNTSYNSEKFLAELRKNEKERLNEQELSDGIFEFDFMAIKIENGKIYLGDGDAEDYGLGCQVDFEPADEGLIKKILENKHKLEKL